MKGSSGSSIEVSHYGNARRPARKNPPGGAGNCATSSTNRSAAEQPQVPHAPAGSHPTAFEVPPGAYATLPATPRGRRLGFVRINIKPLPDAGRRPTRREGRSRTAPGRLSGRRYVSPNDSDRSPRAPMRRKLLQARPPRPGPGDCATTVDIRGLPRLGMPTPTTEEAPRILLRNGGSSWAAALKSHRRAGVGPDPVELLLPPAHPHQDRSSSCRTGTTCPSRSALHRLFRSSSISVLFYFTARDESVARAIRRSPTSRSTWSASSGAGASTTSRASTGFHRRRQDLQGTGRDPGPVQGGTSRRTPPAPTTAVSPARRTQQTGNPGPDPLAPQGQDGPLRPDLA